MLVKIICDRFNHGEISFHSGLNVILGDDDAKNSIGKSSALMVIDFAMGGTSLLEDKAGVIRSLGHHSYSIEFCFGNKRHYFKRSTDSSDIVGVCDSSYEPVGEISLDEYRDGLKVLYGLSGLRSSFRSLIGPFSRIWNKGGGLDPDQPFSGDIKESSAASVGRLIDLFERSDDIAEEKCLLDAHIERKKLISRSMGAEIIPKVGKLKYKANQKLIAENLIAIEGLKQGFTGALSAYEALFDESIRELHQQKNELSTERQELLARIDRLKRDLSGLTSSLTANVALVGEFFPDVDMGRLQQVEAFHKNISKIVQKELKSELEVYVGRLTQLNAEISIRESDIHSKLAAKGTPDDLFAEVFDLKEATDKAAEENRFYDKKAAIEREVSLSRGRLEAIYVGIFLEIESAINSKLRSFNKVVYGPLRSASQLRIKSANSYSFISPEDTGTGKSYAGLVGFDLAMLALTRLPFVIEDSVIYKNIEVPATRNILRILAAVKRKQIFVSFDEAAKFGEAAERLLRTHTALKLSDNDLLYNVDWREQSDNGEVEIRSESNIGGLAN